MYGINPNEEETMKQMTNQDIYTFVAKHLFKQGKRAMNKRIDGFWFNGLRSEDGLKCAIGCLVPDDKYHPGMEEWGIPTILDGIIPVTPDSIRHHFLLALMAAHDDEENWKSENAMKKCLTLISRDYDLRVSALYKLHFPKVAANLPLEKKPS